MDGIPPGRLLGFALGLTLAAGTTAAPLAIQQVYVLERWPTSITLGWDTSLPSSGVAVVRRADGFEESARSGWREPVTAHQVTVPGLVPNTAYRYRVHASADDGSVATSEWQRFVTPQDPSAPPAPAMATAFQVGDPASAGPVDPELARARKLVEAPLASVPAVKLQGMLLAPSGEVTMTALSYPSGPQRARMPGITDLYEAMLARPGDFQAVRLHRIQKTHAEGLEVSQFTVSFRLKP